MPRRKSDSAKDISEVFEKDENIGFKSYKKDGTSSFDALDEGEEIQGIMISIRNQSIMDTRTKKEKEIRVYTVRTDDGVKRISGRTLLDRAFDEILDEHGGYTIESRNYTGAGYQWLMNRAVKLIRGEDTVTKGERNQLGTYEVLVEED